MRTVDISGEPNIAILLEMLEEISRATRPQEAAESFGARIRKLRRTDALISASVRNMPPGQYKITRYFRDGLQVSGAEILGALDPWKEWASLKAHSGGLVGEMIAGGRPKLMHDLRVPSDPIVGTRLADMGSGMAIPLFDGGKALNWALHFRREPDGYTVKDLADYLLNNNLFGAMTRNLVSLDQVRTLNARLREQFEQIARVQQALLPAELPAIPGVRVATSYLTSEQAGGDYYDFFELGEGRWGILIADVSGHGPGAATVMAMLHGILHSYPGLNRGPEHVLMFANARLTAARLEGSFVTAIFAVYDPATRALTVARAGHPLPRLKDARTGEVRVIDGQAGLPLGVMSDYQVRSETLRLQPGQTVVFYTDGITEAFSPQGKMFGSDGLDEALHRCSGEADCVVDTVHRALFDHTGKRTRDDDQTLVVLQVAAEQLVPAPRL